MTWKEVWDARQMPAAGSLRPFSWLTSTVTGVSFLASLVATANSAEPAKIDYNRSIRPILSDRCYKCHGPDAAERKSNLRLDLREEALHACDLHRADDDAGDRLQVWRVALQQRAA